MAVKKTNAKAPVSKVKSPIKMAVSKPVSMPMKPLMSKMEGDDCCTPGMGHKKWMHKIILAVVAVNLVLSIATLSAVKTMWKNEIARIGGKENYKLAQDLYKMPGYTNANKGQILEATQRVSQEMNAQSAQMNGEMQNIQATPSDDSSTAQ
jgi:hypothetical protein